MTDEPVGQSEEALTEEMRTNTEQRLDSSTVANLDTPAVEKVAVDQAKQAHEQPLQSHQISSPFKKFQLGLPLEILHQIFEFLSDSYEPDGIRMATIVVQDLLNAALSCPEFLAALPYGYRYLAGKVTPVKQLPSSYDWDAMIQDPHSHSNTELAEASRALRYIPCEQGSGKLSAINSRDSILQT